MQVVIGLAFIIVVYKISEYAVKKFISIIKRRGKTAKIIKMPKNWKVVK